MDSEVEESTSSSSSSSSPSSSTCIFSSSLPLRSSSSPYNLIHCCSASARKAEIRFQNEYDPTQRAPRGRRPTQRGKRRRPSTSDSESSDGMEYNEFSSYMQIKRDGTITNALE